MSTIPLGVVHTESAHCQYSVHHGSPNGTQWERIDRLGASQIIGSFLASLEEDVPEKSVSQQIEDAFFISPDFRAVKDAVRVLRKGIRHRTFGQ